MDFVDDEGRLTLSYSRDDFHRSITSPRARRRPSRVRLPLHPRAGPAEQWSTTITIVPGGSASPAAVPVAHDAATMRRRSRAKAEELDGWLADAPASRPTTRPGAHLSGQPLRPGRPADASRPRAGDPPRRRPTLVHGAVRPRQPDHQPADPSLRARARGDHAARPRRTAGGGARRLPRNGARQDPPRGAVRRADRARRTPPLAVLRLRRRDAALPRPARRVLPLDRRRGPGPRARAARPRRARLDRRERRRDGDGYVEYERRNQASGLVNQCWKDSWDAIQFADGSLARGPIATAEIQGYAYDAQVRRRALAREVWGDEALADKLEGAPPPCAPTSAATSGCRSAAATRSPSTATSDRSTA